VSNHFVRAGHHRVTAARPDVIGPPNPRAIDEASGRHGTKSKVSYREMWGALPGKRRWRLVRGRYGTRPQERQDISALDWTIHRRPGKRDRNEGFHPLCRAVFSGHPTERPKSAPRRENTRKLGVLTGTAAEPATCPKRRVCCFERHCRPPRWVGASARSAANLRCAVFLDMDKVSKTLKRHAGVHGLRANQRC